MLMSALMMGKMMAALGFGGLNYIDINIHFI